MSLIKSSSRYLDASWSNNFQWSSSPLASFASATSAESDFGRSIYLAAATARYAGAAMETAMPADGVGDTLTPFFDTEAQPVSLPVADNVPDGITGTNPTLTVGGAHIVSTINHLADQDFYAVSLQAGVKYNVGMYAAVGGPSGVPLPDAYIELYDAAGHLVDFADGDGRTPSGEAYGLDAMLTFTVATGGTYYVNARSFDNTEDDGSDNGDTVGDYELFVEVNTDPPAPPDDHYYTPDSPLRAIDWGTQVNKIHQSVRNPDGNEGPRDTGNPQGTTDYSDATALQSLAAAQGKDITGKNVITVYFAKAGEVYVDDDPTTNGTTETMVAKGFADWEIAAYKYAFGAYEKVADVVYLVVDNVYDLVTHTAGADFTFLTYNGTPGPGISLLGRMSPPDTDNEGQSEFNAGDERWTQDNLAPGGLSFTTLIHEMGHGHGLAHPHDNGGSSSVMKGVKPAGIEKEGVPTIPDPVGVWPNYTHGEYSLNQGVFTMMSYEDGWEESPYGQADSHDPFGWLKGLMAFDVAAIQDKYGVNEDTGKGNNTYILEDSNHGTTFDANNNIVQFASGFESIWDVGGVDEIVYNGNRDTTIDLRPATLKYEVGGGGFISYATGIYGGFTVANGVTIENGRSGGGNDTLVGNAVNNILDGGAGNDMFLLNAGGDDSALGGLGDDGFYFGGALTAADQVDGGAGANDQVALQGNYAGLRLGAGNLVGVETLVFLSGSVTRFVDTSGAQYGYDVATVNANVAAGATLTVNWSTLRAGENVTFDGSAEIDGKFMVFAGAGTDRITGGSQNDGFYFAPGTFGMSDRVDGGGGLDNQIALRGDFTGANAISFRAASLANIQTIAVLSGHDTRFGGGTAGDFSYQVTLNNGNAAAGTTLTITAAGLGAAEHLTLNGTPETDASLRIFGGAGADVLYGGGQADTIYGGLGADTLTGGAGGDLFVYRAVEESTSAVRDRIRDFADGDRIDLSKIDAIAGTAGDDAFTFIGADAFHKVAGELRVYQSGTAWIVAGDVDGDGVADLMIQLGTVNGHVMAAADFAF